MKIYLSKTHSDEDGSYEEAKLASLYCNKSDIKKLKEFIDEVYDYMKTNELCHMHFRDSFSEWNKKDYIDIEIDVADKPKLR